jgi:DNA-binding Lrp family transcriptional regulator
MDLTKSRLDENDLDESISSDRNPSDFDTDKVSTLSSRVRELDSRDLEILAELDLNARATAAEIGRSLGMSNNKVNYHIKNLEKMGVIKKYATMIDVYGLGYLNYGFGLKLQYANRKKEKEIMDYLKNSTFTRWCGFAIGRFDIACALWSKSIDQLAVCP